MRRPRAFARLIIAGQLFVAGKRRTQHRTTEMASERAMTEEERYQSAWKRRKLWDRLSSWLGILGFFAVFIPGLVLLNWKKIPTPFLVFAAAWGIACAVAALKNGLFRCPRCNHIFSARPGRRASSMPYCTNCGLPEGSRPGPFIDPRFSANQSNWATAIFKLDH
jgi:hypothetical protein